MTRYMLGFEFLLISLIIMTGSTTADTLDEHPWDINRDGIVNHWEIKILCNYFGQDMPVACYYNPDVNRDGTINIIDLVLVGVHYGEKYERPAQPSAQQPKEGAYFEIVNTSIGMKSYDCPYIHIIVQNKGNRTGYNVACRAHVKDASNTIIDSGFAYFADGGDIRPGEKAEDDAILFNLSSLNDVKEIAYDLTWLER
jgi:hypothetical protein